MELPTPKPIAEIEAMKENRRQGYRDNRQRIINHLKGRGLSNAAIAGLVANIEHETAGSFNFQQKQTKSGRPTDPNTVEHGGYGLFQFDDFSNNTGHRSWYQSYLKDNKKEDSPESQIDYVLDTIFADTQDPNYKYKELTGVGDMGTLKAYLETNKNPSTIAAEFEAYFEKAKVPHSDRRKKIANDIFAELQPVDPDNQFIDQPGDIVDTGEDTPMPDEPESRFKNVPILRHFMKEGGVPMKEQMEMFENGGLMDEGGTVDPVSGNNVPFGSMQEEVRDDIPAQLSEGEFVFPADVVRFIGLNNLMQMRQQAKMGLKEMEAMGQMGNSEEATMPDDLPFDINDLDMEDDMNYNTPQEFNVGGMPNPQSGVFYQPATAPTTGAYQPPPMSVAPTTGAYQPPPMSIAPAPVQAASAQFAAPPRPQQVTTPMIQYQKPDIPFQQFIGGGVEGVEAETVQYKNEAGDIITRRISKATGELIPGQPPIPDGYVKFDPNAPEKEEVTTTPTTTQSTQVSDTSNDDDDGPNRSKGAVIHFGGNRIPGKGQSIENYFMGDLSVGGLGIMDARKYVMSTFAPGQQNIPEGGFATITNITMPRPDGVYSGTGQRLGNDLRMDADIYNQYIAGDGQTKVTQRTRMARVGQHIKEMYTDQGVTGMTVDVDERMINQIDEIDSARKGLRNDPNKNSYSITRRDDDGNENVVATVSKKVAEEIASGVDIEAAAFDYNLPDPPSAFSVDPRTQQDDDPGESGGTSSQDFSAPSQDFSFGPDESDRGRAKGGLVEKPKPKAKKKMKRGGLASKK